MNELEARAPERTRVALVNDYEIMLRGLEAMLRPGHDLGLTLREGEVALFLAQGLRNRDIASALWVSENTVKTHLKSIFQKTAVKSRAEAIVRISRDASFSPKRHEHRGATEPSKRSPKGTHPSR